MLGANRHSRCATGAADAHSSYLYRRELAWSRQRLGSFAYFSYTQASPSLTIFAFTFWGSTDGRGD